MTGTTYQEASELAIRDELREDSRVVYLAPDPPEEFLDEFGSSRVRKTPTSEAAIAGVALGLAVSGLRPVVSWSCATFSYVAFDQLANQIAKVRYLSGGQVNAPLVIRMRYFGGVAMAGQHTATTFATYAHVPGLKLVAPSRAEDAYALMRSAVRDDDPVIFFEADSLRDHVWTSADPTDAGLGMARLVRQGSMATVAAIGSMVPLALETADNLAGEISVEVIDVRSLVPLPVGSIQDSVRKTGRLLVVDESTSICSYAAELIAAIVEDESVFAALRAAPRRVCSLDVIAPYSPVLEDHVRPSIPRIEDAIRGLVGPGANRAGGTKSG